MGRTQFEAPIQAAGATSLCVKGAPTVTTGYLLVGGGRWHTEILSCMQFVLHAGQLGVFYLINFALAEQ